jgi:hypothetical protein
MNKFVLACIATAGIGGQFATASAAPTSGQAPAFSAAGPPTAMAQNVPSQLASLRGEGQALQEQNLQNQCLARNDQSKADPYAIAGLNYETDD